MKAATDEDTERERWIDTIVQEVHGDIWTRRDLRKLSDKTLFDLAQVVRSGQWPRRR